MPLFAMITTDQEMRDEELPERQRIFLDRLRQHDKRVKIFRTAGKNVFHGPVIGDGPMPTDEPPLRETESES
jgi:hypothetical protein